MSGIFLLVLERILLLISDGSLLYSKIIGQPISEEKVLKYKIIKYISERFLSKEQPIWGAYRVM